jgi:hypothetical protein
VEGKCKWLATFVDWYNHRYRHSGIKFVTLRSATLEMPWRSAVTGQSFASRHEKGIHAADHDQSGAGVNR